MRIKDTLLTVIAAGIVFLGGVMMLGKNPFSKKEYRKKDYIVVPDEDAIEETEVASKVEEVPINAKMITTKGEQEKELLSVLREVILNHKTKEVIIPFKEKMVRKNTGKQPNSTYIAHHIMMTQDKKQLHKIREPSTKYSLSNKANFKIIDNDKGG